MNAAINAATVMLNKQVADFEAFFVKQLGAEARGRTSLFPNEHLVLRNGGFFVERVLNKKPPNLVRLAQASNEAKAQALIVLPRLWNACGGSPPMKENTEPTQWQISPPTSDPKPNE